MPSTGSDLNAAPLAEFIAMTDQTNQHAHNHVQKDSETFGSFPHGSESFGNIPHDAERRGSVPKSSERKANHVLSVREVARMFEDSGVARTERSIVNWCQSSKTGIARLDAYFDPNERRYLITPESVGHAIEEEKAKMSKNPSAGAEIRKASEPLGNEAASGKSGELQKLQAELMDSRITNRAKDFVIQQLQADRKEHVERLMSLSQHVGELEATLLQLKDPSARYREIGIGDEHAGNGKAA